MSDTQRLTDRKRVAIVDAAIAEFRLNGFEATSMDKIAATAGVSKRTVYNHFPSKDSLFAEILLRMWERSMSQAGVPYRADLPLRGQLIDLMTQKMDLMTDAPFIDLARVVIAQTIHSPERSMAMVNKLGDKDQAVPVWIRAAQQDGRIKACDPQFAASMMQAPLKSIAFWPQVAMGQPMADAAMQKLGVEVAVDMFLGYFEQAVPAAQPKKHSPTPA